MSACTGRHHVGNRPITKEALGGPGDADSESCHRGLSGSKRLQNKSCLLEYEGRSFRFMKPLNRPTVPARGHRVAEKAADTGSGQVLSNRQAVWRCNVASGQHGVDRMDRLQLMSGNLHSNRLVGLKEDRTLSVDRCCRCCRLPIYSVQRPPTKKTKKGFGSHRLRVAMEKPGLGGWEQILQSVWYSCLGGTDHP